MLPNDSPKIKALPVAYITSLAGVRTPSESPSSVVSIALQVLQLLSKGVPRFGGVSFISKKFLGIKMEGLQHTESGVRWHWEWYQTEEQLSLAVTYHRVQGDIVVRSKNMDNKHGLCLAIRYE